MDIKTIKADFSNLLQATGETKLIARELLKDFIESNHVSIFNYYDFELRMSRGDQTYVVYVAYASTNESPDTNKSVSLVELKHQNFIQIILSDDELDLLYAGKLMNDIENILKQDNHKLDYSKIYALIKKSEVVNEVYMQYK